MTVKVSIITPAYNAAAFLPNTIASVLSQSFESFEWIIVNDGSSDSTAELLGRINDSRVRVIHQENRGVSAARNAALGVSTGEYTTFLDADDMLTPDSIAVRARFLDRHPEVGIVDGVVSYYDAGLSRELRRHSPSPTIEPIFPRLASLDEKCFAGPFYMLRSELIGGVRFEEGLTHCEDLIFFLEIAFARELIYGAVETEVYRYRTGHGSAMVDLNGLESGYLAFLSMLSGRFSVSSDVLRRTSARVSRIMFRSWLRTGHPIRALRAAQRVRDSEKRGLQRA